MNLDEFLKIDDTRNYNELASSLQEWINKAPQLVFEVKPPPAEGEEPAEEAEAAPVNNVPDLLSEARVLQWAGIGFGEEETYRLMKSLKKLVQTSGAG